ncbi:MAG TPA: phosphoribosylformylglycinamidine cyclo-ligase, partial [Spirochaetia bacterium]|nr:phosphoribosylformylglycinamidine cyclo-ligase [Spirochaetia bacterium]
MSMSSYDDAGVSIERGDAFARYIAGLQSSAVGDLGGFAGGIELDLSGYRAPVMLSATDGVGTKLLVARRV